MVFNNTYSFSVGSNKVSPTAYNITVQALIYSEYNPNDIIVRTKTLTLLCPVIWLNILPDLVTDSTQIVSLTS
jgi:hypothetical protein